MYAKYTHTCRRVSIQHFLASSRTAWVCIKLLVISRGGGGVLSSHLDRYHYNIVTLNDIEITQVKCPSFHTFKQRDWFVCLCVSTEKVYTYEVNYIIAMHMIGEIVDP